MRRISDLYAGHHSWLKGWLRKRVSDSDTAADLAQDTFVSVLSKPPQEELEQPRAYLTVIAKRLLSNWYRRRAIEHAYLEELAAHPEACSLSPEDRALTLEALLEIDAMLDKLPAKAREAFLLSQLEGLPHNEIAQRLNISLSTVKRYIVQGFAQCLATLT